ncbi:MAG: hypothetical protein KAY22_11225 [Rhizorhabdus sp.]|uniref:hypothetical protein n=1 Tax=Rhizorhabdus sp. TaxID=1968843 RepID=UPI001B6CC6C2|nr:hypothetical protein [Rhizorhabdus sp.]MBP8232866.1 hypothetical protein [Rhizorhabdus sp.]
MGYSHHADVDHENVTIETAQLASTGQMQKFPFFARLPTYLNLDRADFWQQVVFLNFVPTAIGDASRRYAWASREMHERGFERLKRMIATHRPTHIFVVTPKPDADHYAPFRIRDLGPYSAQRFDAAGRPVKILDASVEGHRTRITILPHPQAARTNQMRAAFSHALSG